MARIVDIPKNKSVIALPYLRIREIAAAEILDKAC
jgi:hypothetical protein